MKDNYTIAEAAHLMGVTYQRVTQIINDGHLRTFRVGPTKRFVRIKKSDLENYMQLCGKSLQSSEATQ